MSNIKVFIFISLVTFCTYSQTIQLPNSQPNGENTNSMVNLPSSTQNTTDVIYDANALAQISQSINDILASLNKTDTSSSSISEEENIQTSTPATPPELNTKIEILDNNQLTGNQNNPTIENKTQLINIENTKAADLINQANSTYLETNLTQPNVQTNNNILTQNNSTYSQSNSSLEDSKDLPENTTELSIPNNSINISSNESVTQVDQKKTNKPQLPSPVDHPSDQSPANLPNEAEPIFDDNSALCKTDADCLIYGTYDQLKITCNRGLCIIS